MKKLIFIALLFFAFDKVNSGILLSKFINEETFTKYRLNFAYESQRDDFINKVAMPSIFTNAVISKKEIGQEPSQSYFYYIEWRIDNLTKFQINQALAIVSVTRQWSTYGCPPWNAEYA